MLMRIDQTGRQGSCRKRLCASADFLTCPCRGEHLSQVSCCCLIACEWTPVSRNDSSRAKSFSARVASNAQRLYAAVRSRRATGCESTRAQAVTESVAGRRLQSCARDPTRDDYQHPARHCDSKVSRLSLWSQSLRSICKPAVASIDGAVTLVGMGYKNSQLIRRPVGAVIVVVFN